MSQSLATLLLRLSEAGEPAILAGRQAKPYFGRQFDRALSRGLLIEQAPAAEWPVCGSCECDLDVRPIQRSGDAIVAPCPLDAGADACLTEDDLRTFSVSISALVDAVAVDNGIADRPSELMPGLWHLGSLPPANSNSRSLFFACPLNEDLVGSLLGAMRAVARTERAALLLSSVPSLATRHRLEEAGIAMMVVGEGLAKNAPAKPFRLDLGYLWAAAAAGVRLEVFRGERTIRFEGVRIPLSRALFTFIDLVATAAASNTSPVLNDTLAAALRAGAIPHHRVNILTRGRFVAKLKAHGIDKRTADGLVLSRKAMGYELSLRAEEIAIFD